MLLWSGEVCSRSERKRWGSSGYSPGGVAVAPDPRRGAGRGIHHRGLQGREPNGRGAPPARRGSHGWRGFRRPRLRHQLDRLDGPALGRRAGPGPAPPTGSEAANGGTAIPDEARRRAGGRRDPRGMERRERGNPGGERDLSRRSDGSPSRWPGGPEPPEKTISRELYGCWTERWAISEPDVRYRFTRAESSLRPRPSSLQSAASPPARASSLRTGCRWRSRRPTTASTIAAGWSSRGRPRR